MTKIHRGFRTIGFFLAFVTIWSLGGCGGETATTDNDTDQAGLNIFRISKLPSFGGFFNNSSIAKVGGSPDPPVWKVQAAGTTGAFCPEFCYLKQGILEAVRQNQELDLFACLARKANEFSGRFELPDTSGSSCSYYEVVPPSSLTGTGEVPSLLRFRLCRDGDTVKIHTCAGGVPQQELILTNDTATASVSGTVFKKFENQGGCEDKSKVAFSANCDPGEFSNPDCQASLHGTYCGCDGDGTLNYDVTGGDTPQVTFESDFAAGGLGADTAGSYDSCAFGDWASGGEGCFKSQALGSYLVIPSSEVPLSAIEGCEGVVGVTSVCPNPDFNPDSIDLVYPTCPFLAESGASCAFDFQNVDCCSVSGDTLETQTGSKIDNGAVATLFDSVSAHECPGQGDCDTLAFEEAWDCELGTGKTFFSVDLNAATGIDFSECTATLDEVNAFAVEENCDEQTADQAGDEVIQEVAALASCASTSDCGAGSFCHLIDDNGTPGDTTDDVMACITEPASCDPSSSACDAGETCAYDPELSHAACVPAILCEADCTATLPCHVDTSLCEAVGCDIKVANDCVTKLGSGYLCDSTSASCSIP